MIDSTVSAGREPMDPTDVAWLRMDSDTNLMVVTSVFLLAEPITLARLRATMEARFLLFDRFRQRIVKNITGADYESDPAFDIANHVEAVPRGVVRSKRDLQRLAGRLAMQPLDPERPLWHMDLVRNYQGGSAAILRIHHCYADGIAMIQVLFAMTDANRSGGKPVLRPPKRRAGGNGRDAPFGTRLERAAGATLHLAEDLWSGSMHAVRHPAEAVDLAAAGAETLEELVRTTVTPPDPPTRLNQDLSGVKRVAWAEPISLAGVKSVSKALGCTINDVLVSCATGALRAYLVAQGDDVDGLEFHAEIPVNIRSPDEAFGRLGNRFGLVLLELPVGIANPFERLFEVHRRMTALKDSRQPVAAYLMLNVMGRLPEAVERPMLRFFTTKATAVMTNVPGPRESVYFGGSELRQLLFWVPQAGTVGIGISIFSYRGTVQIGLIADENLIADPEDVTERFATEFRALADRLRDASPPRVADR
jgi:WS/DGAT/MGAT family acyltransferase